MSERFFATVVNVVDPYTIVINAGLNQQVSVGTHFVIVGLGESITDPSTNEDLGQLEVVRGRAKVTHVQERMATLAAAEYVKQPDAKEIKKVRTVAGNALGNFFGPQEQTTESIKPSEPVLQPLRGVQVGDRVIAVHPT